ncbi:MAG: YerC/YecD family TrpR-related protein [Bacillota bacterium]|nr:YerC/YecD family TrpR-related protein [Bacillota bacterium]
MAYEAKFKSDNVDKLFETILNLEDLDECYRFFDDLMTIKEIQSISQRWEVAMLLAKGETYQEIEQKTKASTATISRINKCIQYGADGYNRALKKLDK